MKKVYIAHPLRGENRAKNVEEVTRICQKITELFPGVLPISPIHAFSFLDNTGFNGEEKAMELCIEMLKNCDEAWFFGDWQNSVGCQAEFDAAHVRRIYGAQDCEQILTLSVCSPDEGNRSKCARWLLEGNSSELARWLLSEVYEPPLAPCPFCGEAPSVEAKEDDCCGKIRCSSKDCLAHVYVEWDDFSSVVPNRGEAVAAWNRRVGE